VTRALNGASGRGASALAIAFLLLVVAAACGGGTTGSSPTGSSATAGCAADHRAAGALPQLEALLPRGMIERSPDSVDSGWNCTAEALGTYATHGIHELRFSGATWDNGSGDATVAAILTTRPGDPALQAAWVEEFYETGARAARHTENIETSRPSMPGAGQVFRLDTLNGLSLQTVVVWPAATTVRVVIVATTVGPDASRADHDQRVATAVEVAAAVPVAAP
jgi:hypothetical protein